MRDENDVKTIVKYEYIIEKIMNTLTHPGELYTDGECMDEVWVLLESKGYNLNFLKKEKKDYYNTHGKEAYKKEYL